jgi:hypothetical protein
LSKLDDQRRAAANIDLAQKLKLEQKAIRELRSLFSKMTSDMKVFIENTGAVQDADIYNDELRGILANQYRRSSAVPLGRITTGLRDTLKDPENEAIAPVLAVAAATSQTAEQIINEIEMEAITETSSINQAFVDQDMATIPQTNQEQLDSALVFGIAAVANELGRNVTREDNERVAQVSARKFKQNSVSRSNTIAATTTQGGFEGAKFAEFEALKNNIAQTAIIPIAPDSEAEEVWTTVGDNKVRTDPFSHVAADGQIKNGVFNVGGQLLRFPRDTSLGATAANVINCRCANIPVFNGQVIYNLFVLG